MSRAPFTPSDHIYRSKDFSKLIQSAVDFFLATPVHDLPLSERFIGAGVYALYYFGDNPLYKPLGDATKRSCSVPIYIGKAVPRGWRQARVSAQSHKASSELHSRIKEHTRNIEAGAGLRISDFKCRFVLFEAEGSDMIGTIEAALIKQFRPLWNSAVDGFGNHTPGKGRFNQAKSDWDVLHPGRLWAEKCRGLPKAESTILANIKAHFAGNRI